MSSNISASIVNNDARGASISNDISSHLSTTILIDACVVSSSLLPESKSTSSDTSSGLSISILNDAREATFSFLPKKSKAKYEYMYKNFCAWRLSKKVDVIDENVLLAYFFEKVCYFQYYSFKILFLFLNKYLISISLIIIM